MSTKDPNSTVRPTKKQRDLLTFIEEFIKEHGYSPSYREIMNGLNYTSVATVSLHVNSLIRRGHLAKRDRSARSLEVVQPGRPAAGEGASVAAVVEKSAEEIWLAGRIDDFITSVTAGEPSIEGVLKLQSIHEAVQLLGLTAVADEVASAMAALQARLSADNDTRTAGV